MHHTQTRCAQPRQALTSLFLNQYPTESDENPSGGFCIGPIATGHPASVWPAGIQQSDQFDSKRCAELHLGSVSPVPHQKLGKRRFGRTGQVRRTRNGSFMPMPKGIARRSTSSP